jgi:hypothetical protein
MIEMIYVSKASNRFTEKELNELLATARTNNTKTGLTGLLLYDGQGTFIQVLEGEESTIEALYKTIKNDKRHSRINVLWRKEIEERGFPDWKMGYQNILDMDTSTIMGFSDFLQQNKKHDYVLTNPGFVLNMLTHFKSKHQ